ncbi:TetR/AcrR family transcriptional regulator [Actinomadura scrupuli]|uniref:TetR/AcrR family transcriptional regulator n=1 Tax=Actinomadura scrupuli TaxID=559629 RepID=UPI003D986174
MTETTERLAARPPGRPRSERAEKAIIDATLDLLIEEAGVAGVTIEAVAARAGVGKTTIYRRWANKEALIVDALATLKEPVPPLAGVTARDDLITLTQAIRPPGDRRFDCVWNILGGAAKHPELVRKFQQDVLEPRREVFRGVLRRGVASGEFRDDLDIEVAEAIILGAMTLRARSLDRDRALPEDFAPRLVDTVLRGFSAR